MSYSKKIQLFQLFQGGNYEKHIRRTITTYSLYCSLSTTDVIGS